MAKQPIKKKVQEEISAMSGLDTLKKFKKENNLGNIKEKELTWIQLPDAFYEAVRIPGIPKGYVSAVRGHSNTGKSTIKLEVIAACQRQNILPVIFETENNFAWEHARDIGMQFEDVVDEETGEILDRDGFFLYYDSSKLYELYGKMDHDHAKELSKPNRDTYVIEDIAYCIKELIRKQKAGDIPFDMCFIWDSVGVGDCYRSAVANSSNNMWYAGALSVAFNTIVNDLIPSSRRESSKYTNTMMYVNKIWIENTAMGLPAVKNKGGNSLLYATRIFLHVGGIASPSIKVLKATSKGRDYQYGIKTKIKVDKNHVNNITYEGEICSLQQGLWNPDKLDEYKKQYASFIKSKLEEQYSNEEFDEDENINFMEEEKLVSEE